MGYPALRRHNSFLFILKTMNFGTMNLNFRTLHSHTLAKFRARQGDGDNARTSACDSITEVNCWQVSDSQHQVSDINAQDFWYIHHPPCPTTSRRTREEAPPATPALTLDSKCPSRACFKASPTSPASPTPSSCFDSAAFC